MTHADQIAAALRLIHDGEAEWISPDDLKCLAADYERQREAFNNLSVRADEAERERTHLKAEVLRRDKEIERLRDQVEYLLQRNGVLEEVNNNLRYVKDHAKAERERLKAQLASIKDHADEYLVNEDLTAEKAMRLIGRKLS